MAVRLGELQAQMMRLDGLGERLARVAGLKPQELPSFQPGQVAGTGGPVSSRPGRDLSVQEFTALVDKLARDVETRSDELGMLEALLVQTSTNRKFLPSLRPIRDGWHSSNFGQRIDPISGENSFHEGLDFPAATGTPIVAAASGKVIYAGWHPQYGKIVEIDHGSGLVTRYAHVSQFAASGRRSRGAGPARGECRLDRPLDGSAPAFRGSAERCSAESGTVPRIELDAVRVCGRGERHAGLANRAGNRNGNRGGNRGGDRNRWRMQG